MNIFTIVGFVIAAVFLSLTLKGYRPEYSLFIGLAVTIVILSMVIPDIGRLLNFINTAIADNRIISEKLGPLTKALGIGIVTEIAADTCRDAGESSMASRIELAGKTAILIISIPLAEEVLNLVAGLLK